MKKTVLLTLLTVVLFSGILRADEVIARVFLQQAEKEKKKTERQIELINTAVKECPEYMDAWLALAKAYENTGFTFDALDAYKQCVELAKTGKGISDDFEKIKTAAEKKTAELQPRYDELAAIVNSYTAELLALAATYMFDDPAFSIILCDRALAIKPGSIEAQNLKKEIILEKKNNPEKPADGKPGRNREQLIEPEDDQNMTMVFGKDRNFQKLNGRDFGDDNKTLSLDASDSLRMMSTVALLKSNYAVLVRFRIAEKHKGEEFSTGIACGIINADEPIYLCGYYNNALELGRFQKNSMQLMNSSTLKEAIDTGEWHTLKIQMDFNENTFKGFIDGLETMNFPILRNTDEFKGFIGLYANNCTAEFEDFRYQETMDEKND